VTDSTAVDYANIPHIVIRPLGSREKPSTSGNEPVGGDDWSDVATDNPAVETKTVPDDWSDVAVDTAPKTERKVGAGEAGVLGAVDMASFGLAPALVGATEAGKTAHPEIDQSLAGVPSEAPGMEDIGAGLASIFGSHPDPKAREAYERGRQAVLENQQLAHEQHPLAFLGGQLVGGLLTPTFGAGTAGTLGARLATGAAAGAAGGALYGAGSGVSQGLPASEIAAQAGIGGLEGGVVGGALKGAIGPRLPVPSPPLTAGQRAAQTAVGLGAPIPRGIASDNRLVRGTTAAIGSVPVFGARVHNALDATRHAAGEAVGQSGIDDAIAANKWTQNQLYNDVRGRINPDLPLAMPKTAAAVAQVRAARVAARQHNPDQGLEQFNNIAQQGASFNGAHRARVDAREAGNVLSPNPGYNAADYNKITRAMTEDIRHNIALQGGQPAVHAFERAERSFGPLAEANKFLSRIAKQKGPGAGLDEIGFNPSTGEFSLDKFVTAWNKINPNARRFVPAPGQVNNINAIAQMGEHIKSSMRERNTSHTSNILILWDLARDAAMLGVGAATGFVSGASVLGGAAGAVPAIGLMHWLSSPANAAAMASWSRAYRAVLQDRTPARIAGFNIATRNMANTLGLDPAKVTARIQALTGATPATADDEK
jgi:hypothetical protein